jgi:hypothetical protein
VELWPVYTIYRTGSELQSTLVQQIILGLASGALLVGVQRSARRGRLEFGLAVGWWTIGLIGLGAVALIPLVPTLGRFLGLAPGVILSSSVAVVLAGIALSLSVRATRAECGLQDVIEALGVGRIEPPLQHSTLEFPTLAIVPAFNEERSIAHVVTELREIGLPVLVIDDGSSDGTRTAARRAGASVLPLASNLGVGGAVRAGLAAAVESGYGQVVQCDGDGQHPASEVHGLVMAMQQIDADLLVGSRFAAGDTRRPSILRGVAMRLLAYGASRATGTRITDASSGLRVIRGQLLVALADSMPRHYLGDTYEALLAAGRAGYRVREHPVRMQPREFGASSAGFSSAVRLTLRALAVTVLGTHPRLPRAENP